MSRGTNRNRNRAITLLELMIALVLLCLLVLGISNLDVFFRQVFMGADRKAKIINDASYVVEHMGKNIGRAVGDANNTPVVYDSPPAFCTKAVLVWLDDAAAMNGIRDVTDDRIMYCFNNTTHSVTYYPDYLLAPGPSEVLSRNILKFNVTPWRNSVDLNITGCFNAGTVTGPRACGTPDNPSATFQTRIMMPSVSVNATP